MNRIVLTMGRNSPWPEWPVPRISGDPAMEMSADRPDSHGVEFRLNATYDCYCKTGTCIMHTR